MMEVAVCDGGVCSFDLTIDPIFKLVLQKSFLNLRLSSGLSTSCRQIMRILQELNLCFCNVK